MGEGSGSCNSWESKYRYRKSERVCPQCGKDTIIKGKQEYGGGWICFTRKGGCNAKFKAGDQSIEGQQTGRIANPDIFDLVNTVLKMANKRAKIAATLNATSAHEFFTQDMEDITQIHAEAAEIDTGGHPVGTQAAANYVAQQKLATGAQRAAAAPVQMPTPQPEQLPEELSVMLSEMRGLAEMCDVFARLKARLVAVCGGSAGEAEYYRILKQHGGVEHANKLKQRAARTTAIKMYEAIQQAEALGVSDSDMPYPRGEFAEMGDRQPGGEE
jgi:hypothetical protein